MLSKLTGMQVTSVDLIDVVESRVKVPPSDKIKKTHQIHFKRLIKMQKIAN